MQKRYTTIYRLIKDDEVLEFHSEKEACDFLGVKKCSVASCYRWGCKCKGYTVERVGISSHHQTKTRLFKIWCSMHERCEREKHPHYHNYGGRGIAVCDEWKEFEPFMEWAMSHGYEDKLTIDREDNDGNYTPENCRWITVKEQQNNKRTNHVICFNGVSRTITEWSELLGINATTIRARIKAGWSIEKALTTPAQKRTKMEG